MQLAADWGERRGVRRTCVGGWSVACYRRLGACAANDPTTTDTEELCMRMMDLLGSRSGGNRVGTRLQMRLRAMLCLWAMVFAVLGPMAGCKSGTPAGGGDSGGGSVPQTGSDASAMLGALARYLPSDTVAVASLDLSLFLGGYGSLLTDALGMTQTELKAMTDELSGFLLERLGWNVNEVRWCFAAISESQQVVLLVKGDLTIKRGLEPLPGSAGLKGLRVVDDLTLIPLAEQGLYALLFDKKSTDWFSNHTTTLATPEGKARLSALQAVLQKGGNTSLFSMAITLVDAKFSKKLMADAPPAVQRLRAASMTVGSSLSVVLHGDNADLLEINKILEAAIAQAEQMIKAKYAELPKLDTAEGLAVIFASHIIKPSSKRLMPTVSGEFSTLSAKMESDAMGLLMGAYIAGILAAVAIPSFKKYEDKSQDAEAQINLRAISNGAMLYSHQETFDPATGQIITSRFPVVASEVCTTTGNAGQRQPPNASDFMQAPWMDLNFSIDHPHAFRYCYQSTPDGSTFTATATNDSSVFKIHGAITGGQATISPVEDVSQ